EEVFVCVCMCVCVCVCMCVCVCAYVCVCVCAYVSLYYLWMPFVTLACTPSPPVSKTLAVFGFLDSCLILDLLLDRCLTREVLSGEGISKTVDFEQSITIACAAT